MKKLMLALLAGAVVLASASFAFADGSSITVGGQIDIRWDYWGDLALNNHANDTAAFGEFLDGHGPTQGSKSQSFFAETVTLNVDAKITEGLEAFVEMQSDRTEEQWGGQDGVGLNPGRIAGGGTASGFNYLNHQMDELSIKQAWINFMIPGAPVGVKIGHQPLALGHGIFLDTHRQGSDAILLYSKPMPQLLLAAAYISGFETPFSSPGTGFNGLGTPSGKNNNINTGADFYAVLANYTFMENNTVGANFTYVHDNASLQGGFGPVPDDRRIWATNAMLTADGAFGPLSYKGEVDWLYINVDDVFGPGKNYTESGWAAMLNGTYKLPVMGATIGVETAYGTGNDNDRINFVYAPAGAGFGPFNSAGGFGKTRDTAYATPYGATSYNYAFLYNDKIGQGPLGQGGGFGFGDGFGGFGLANTGYVKISAGITPIDRLTAGLDVLVLNASAQRVRGQSRYLGTEVDAHMDYKIYDNLMLNVTGGVFVPGAWYKYGGEDGEAASLATNPSSQLENPADPESGFKTDTAWGLETKLTVKF